MAIEEVNQELWKEYSTSEVPAFGQLIKAILELTKAGVIKWRNHVDQDRGTLRLNILSGWRCSKRTQCSCRRSRRQFHCRGSRHWRRNAQLFSVDCCRRRDERVERVTPHLSS